jgi:hypothetical protein
MNTYQEVDSLELHGLRSTLSFVFPYYGVRLNRLKIHLQYTAQKTHDQAVLRCSESFGLSLCYSLLSRVEFGLGVYCIPCNTLR